MFEWISLRATAAAPGPSTHQRSLAALGGVLRIHAHIQGRDRERAERRGIGRRRGAWRRHRGHKVEDSGDTFWYRNAGLVPAPRSAIRRRFHMSGPRGGPPEQLTAIP